MTHPLRKRGGIFHALCARVFKAGGSFLHEKGMASSRMSTGGEVANALVCKTSIRGFNSRPVLQLANNRKVFAEGLAN